MLLQSHMGTVDHPELDLLPALPSAWKTGHVTGLRGRGGYEVEISWKDGKFASAKIKSLLGRPLKLRCGRKEAEMKTEAGKEFSIDGALQLVR